MGCGCYGVRVRGKGGQSLLLKSARSAVRVWVGAWVCVWV